MSDVFGPIYAKLYDLLNTSKNYQTETDFANEIVQRVSDRDLSELKLLDVGCGTGRHLQCFSRSYFSVTGLDRSSSMAEIARQRNPGATIVVGTLESHADNLGEFDVVVSLFDVLSYQTENEDVKSFLGHARALMQPDGILLVDFWHLAGLIKQPPSTRATIREERERRIVRVSTPEIDWATATTKVSIWTQESDGAKILSETLESHDMRAFNIQEIESLAQSVGLDVVASGGWLDSNSMRPTANDWHAFALLKRV